MKELRIERNFPSDPVKVFAYVTQMDNLLKWWGPEGTSIGEHNLDLSKTGDWFFVLVDPAGGRHRVSGKVLAVDAPRSVEFTLIVHSQTGPPSIDSVVRFEVSPDGAGGADFVLIQTGLSSEQIVEGSTQGWVSTLRRLEELLT
ncbi:MAG: SRPBCC domain-containing protein [Paracoccaceae bacterium]